MKRLLIPLIALVVFQSCSTAKPRVNNDCGTENYKHKFRAGVKLLETGTIARAIAPIKVELISIKRTMKGVKHVFVSDKGDTIVRYFHKPLKEKLYLIRTV